MAGIVTPRLRHSMQYSRHIRGHKLHTSSRSSFLQALLTMFLITNVQHPVLNTIIVLGLTSAAAFGTVAFVHRLLGYIFYNFFESGAYTFEWIRTILTWSIGLLVVVCFAAQLLQYRR
jgi:hypothetical protein